MEIIIATVMPYWREREKETYRKCLVQNQCLIDEVYSLLSSSLSFRILSTVYLSSSSNHANTTSFVEQKPESKDLIHIFFWHFDRKLSGSARFNA